MCRFSSASDRPPETVAACGPDVVENNIFGELSVQCRKDNISENAFVLLL